uniref:TSA: Wollemia nobilis Ref_Wollemi_Transcript_15486_1307 transcribed RNA sequence n=1 Tax=Wollemia nobilis TaxID=56998 RepID=A0A0C9S389_9CONI
MGKGPGLHSDIGKKTRDLLYKDFLVDQKFSLTTYTSTGVAFTSTGTKKGELFLGDLNTQLKNKNITTDIKVDTRSSLFTTVTIDEPAPGVKAIFSYTVPDQRSGKVELQYLHDNAGITTSIGLTAAPLVECSGVIGNESVAVGGEVAFDTASGNITKYNAGLSYVKPDFVSSLQLADKGDTLKASYLHTVSPLTKTAVGAEIAHSFSKNENSFTVGSQHALDPLTTLKGRMNNHGKIAALVQHEWRPKSFVTFSGEVDSKALDNSAKMGISVVLKP